MPYDTPYNRMIANNQINSNERYAKFNAYSNQMYNSSLPFSEVHKEVALPQRRFIPHRNVISNFDGGITNRNMEGNGLKEYLKNKKKKLMKLGRGHSDCASCGLHKCACREVGGRNMEGGFWFLAPLVGALAGKAIDVVSKKIGFGDMEEDDETSDEELLGLTRGLRRHHLYEEPEVAKSVAPIKQEPRSSSAPASAPVAPVASVKKPSKKRGRPAKTPSPASSPDMKKKKGKGDYEDVEQFKKSSKEAQAKKAQKAQEEMKKLQQKAKALKKMAKEQDSEQGVYASLSSDKVDGDSSSSGSDSDFEDQLSTKMTEMTPAVDRSTKPKGKGKGKGKGKKQGGSVLGGPSNDPVNKGKIGGQKYMKSTGLHWEGATLGAGVEGDIKEVMVASKKGKGKKTGSALFKTSPVVPLDVKSGNPPSEEQIEGIHDFKEEPMGKGKKGKKGGMIKSEMKGSTFSGGAKTRKPNKWIEHVKDYAKKHNVKYSEAIKLAKASYKK